MTDYLELRAQYPDGDIPAALLETYDEARTTWALEVAEAAERMAELWSDPDLAHDAGGKFTCLEMGALLDLFRAVGETCAFDVWLEGHGASDDDEFDSHHDIYLKNLEEVS